MKKIINEPTQVVDEMLQGLSFIHDDLVERLDGFDVIVRNAEKTGKLVSFQVEVQDMNQVMLDL